MKNEKSAMRKRNLSPNDRRARLAFTLIEMMVVLGMLGILMGVAFSGIGKARNQARVAKANVEVRELINAWLSYEAAHDDWPTEISENSGSAVEADADHLKVLLGKGEDKTVYLNAQLVNGKFLDPWGQVYKFRLLGESGQQGDSEKFVAAVTFPNRYRNVNW